MAKRTAEARRPLASRSSGWARYLAARLTASRITPNQISVLSIAWAVPGGALLCWSPGWPAFISVAVCVQLRLLCNLLDGVRGLFGFRTEQTRAAGGRPSAPHPESACRLAVSDLSPQAGRSDRECDQIRCAVKGGVAGLGIACILLLAPGVVRAQLGAARQACAADIKQLCPEVKPGEGRLKACVKKHFGQLSAACQSALISNVTITKSCKADANEKCPGVQPGGGRIQACMKDHFTELTEPCKDALLLAKLQQQ